MVKQQDVPAKSGKVQSAQEIMAILKGLPERDRIRLEGIIIGMDLAHKSVSLPTDRTAQEKLRLINGKTHT